MGTQFSQLPVVFLSFDEPYADAHYKRLVDRIPHAKRVHGVKGFDAAHKAAAEAADADEFITVDADNIVLEHFWHQYLDARPNHYKDCVLSWRSFNLCNGLQYGNGGLKLWRREFIKNMVTHEEAQRQGKTLVDFCWDPKYIQLRSVFSVTDFTTSAHHAWRAGFREGAKMPLKEGEPPPTPSSLMSFAYASCLQRLKQWAGVGRDLNYGSWAMAGTIEGLLRVHVTKVTNLSSISSYDSILEEWNKTPYVGSYLPRDPFSDSNARKYLEESLHTIFDQTGLHLITMGPTQSSYVRQWLWPTVTNDTYEKDSWHTIHW